MALNIKARCVGDSEKDSYPTAVFFLSLTSGAEMRLIGPPL